MKILLMILIIMCSNIIFCQRKEQFDKKIPEGYEKYLIIIKDKKSNFPEVELIMDEIDSSFAFILKNDTLFKNSGIIDPVGAKFSNNSMLKEMFFCKNWQDTFRLDKKRTITFANPIPELYFESELSGPKILDTLENGGFSMFSADPFLYREAKSIEGLTITKALYLSKDIILQSTIYLDNQNKINFTKTITYNLICKDILIHKNFFDIKKSEFELYNSKNELQENW